MGGNSKKIFDETLIKLFLISLPFFLILFFTIEDIFRIVFGKNWTIAGYYCKILLPVFFMRFIAIPLSITMEIFSRQIYNLIWQLGLLIINALIFIFTIIYKLNFTFYLVLTSACLSIYYFLNLLLSRKSCCN